MPSTSAEIPVNHQAIRCSDAETAPPAIGQSETRRPVTLPAWAAAAATVTPGASRTTIAARLRNWFVSQPGVCIAA